MSNLQTFARFWGFPEVIERPILGVLSLLANVRFCPKADVSLFPIAKLKFPAHWIKFPVKFLGKSMKNPVVSLGCRGRSSITSLKNENFPVNSLLLGNFSCETCSQMTSYTTKLFTNRSDETTQKKKGIERPSSRRHQSHHIGFASLTTRRENVAWA